MTANATMNVLEGRQGEAPAWDIPLRHPSHHWAVPLAVIEGGHPRRVGTAFHISRLGHLLTARHCVDEALDLKDRATELGQRTVPVRTASQLAVVRAADDARNRVVGHPVQTVTAPEPSDLSCLSPLTQDQIPQLTLPLSFALPDAGATVRCFGFPFDASGKLFPDSLHAVEGKVKAYFSAGFARGFMKGPSFVVAANVPPGMSGGPVVNEHGAVCGVVSAGAEMFFDEPCCLVSPLYPALLIEVALHGALAPNALFNATRTFLDLCAEGIIPTDGTEDRVHFWTDENGTEIGPLLRPPNGAFVYDSLDDYLAGRASTPIHEPRMRVRIHEPERSTE